MKSIILCSTIAVICLAAFAAAWPLAEPAEFDQAAVSDYEPYNDLAFDAMDVPVRQKRATCDLLSGFGVNHSACAAHCILRGNRGGSCNGRGVCVCRN